MVTAEDCGLSVTKITSSSATFRSSTLPALPRSLELRSLILLTIGALVDFDNFSISLFFTLLTAKIPAFAK